MVYVFLCCARHCRLFSHQWYFMCSSYVLVVSWSEPRAPSDWLLTATCIISGHLNQSKDLLVKLLWYVRPVHLEIKELFWYLPSLALSKQVSASSLIKLHTRRLLLDRACLWLFRLGRLLNDWLVLGETRDLVHAEFSQSLRFLLGRRRWSVLGQVHS